MKNRSLNVSPSPFVFSCLSLERASAVVLASLLVQVALMALYADIRSLVAVAASLAGAAAAELCFSPPFFVIRGKPHKKFFDGTAAISGLLAAFLLPLDANPVLAGIASFFALFVSRNFFNGKGNSWISAPVLSALFVFLSSPESFSLASIAVEFSSGEAESGLFRALGISIPEGYVSLFFNPQAPVPALKFGIVTIASFIVLVAIDVADWIVPVASILACAAGICLFSTGENALSVAGSDVLAALFSGGLFFAAVYLLSDFSSIPRTRTGRLLLGIIAGAAALFICGREGASILASVFTVFAANIASLVIEYCESRILRACPLENILHGKND